MRRRGEGRGGEEGKGEKGGKKKLIKMLTKLLTSLGFNHLTFTQALVSTISRIVGGWG